MKTIGIYVEGGIIQEIANIPEGVRVFVRDYDHDASCPDEEYIESLYEHEPGAPGAPWVDEGVKAFLAQDGENAENEPQGGAEQKNGARESTESDERAEPSATASPENGESGWFAATRWSGDDVLAALNMRSRPDSHEEFIKANLEEFKTFAEGQLIDDMVERGWDSIQTLMDDFLEERIKEQ